MHDYYPRWPLLGVHPEPYLEHGKPVSLQRPLEEHRLQAELSDRDAAAWEKLGDRWREAVVTWGVRVVAPSRSVVDLLRRLDPAWSAIDIEILPHGLPPLPGTAEVVPKNRADGRLRLVIPGRIQPGKGQRLLQQALPELRRYARVCLLGAGPSAEVFFGQPDVDVIIQYRREELRDLLATIGPHVSGLVVHRPRDLQLHIVRNAAAADTGRRDPRGQPRRAHLRRRQRMADRTRCGVVGRDACANSPPTTA